MKLISALGLDIRILFAQLINFAILIFVLWRFAYKPVFAILEERRNKVIKSVKDSEKAEKKLAEADKLKKEIIAISRQEANKIIEESKKKAEARYQEIITKSKNDVQSLIEEEKSHIEIERSKALQEIKNEAAQMIYLAISKVLSEKVDSIKDAELINKVIKDLK